MAAYFEDHSLEPEHGSRSLRAGAAVLGARVLVTVIQLLTFLVLARLLYPEDYGLVGMVAAITAFAPLLVSLGTPDAVVQRARINEGEISALFWLSATVGCSAALMMAACGPLIARFYGEPRLIWIAEISALTFVVSAFYCQHNTLLRRAMKFKELAEMSSEELQTKKRDMRQESLHLRLQQQSGQLEQPSRLRLLRRDVAKIETVLSQRAKKSEAAKAEKK